MTIRLYSAVVSMALAGLACSSSSSSATGTVQAPMIMGVEPMAGALHITWMNQQSDCDSVVAERKMGTAAYAAAFTVPGDVDNKMDTSATDDMTYTYRLRCQKGSTFSAYSDEMSANPHMVDGGAKDAAHE
jgi:hypothetical protein